MISYRQKVNSIRPLTLLTAFLLFLAQMFLVACDYIPIASEPARSTNVPITLGSTTEPVTSTTSEPTRSTNVTTAQPRLGTVDVCELITPQAINNIFDGSFERNRLKGCAFMPTAASKYKNSIYIDLGPAPDQDGYIPAPLPGYNKIEGLGDTAYMYPQRKSSETDWTTSLDVRTSQIQLKIALIGPMEDSQGETRLIETAQLVIDNFLKQTSTSVSK